MAATEQCMRALELANEIRLARATIKRRIYEHDEPHQSVDACIEVLEEGHPFLQKPFTPRDLAVKIREVLDRSEGD